MKKYRNYNRSKYLVNFNEDLHDLDTEKQTYGCRSFNPNTCLFYCIDNECAFVREDHLCKRPSKRWNKQYKKLKENEK